MSSTSNLDTKTIVVSIVAILIAGFMFKPWEPNLPPTKYYEADRVHVEFQTVCAEFPGTYRGTVIGHTKSSMLVVASAGYYRRKQERKNNPSIDKIEDFSFQIEDQSPGVPMGFTCKIAKKYRPDVKKFFP